MMKQEEYLKTMVYNGHMVNIGVDDYGQQYFLEYVEGGYLVQSGAALTTKNCAISSTLIRASMPAS